MADIITASDASFDAEVSDSPVPVLVDFTASWCAPCKALLPIVERLASDLGDKVKIVKVDVDDCPATATRFKVRGVPTLMAFDHGVPVGSLVGLHRDQAIRALLKV